MEQTHKKSRMPQIGEAVFCIAYLFFLSGNTGGYGLWRMSVAILISFACYFPVVLWAKKKPAIGMLMMPKTAAYIWMICMGLGVAL